MKEYKYSGFVENKEGRNTLVIHDRRGLQDDLSHFSGKAIELVLRSGVKRSNPQNRWYWGVAIPVIRNYLIEVGIEFTKEQTHEMIKLKFLKAQAATSDGEVVEYIRGTSSLTTIEFSEFVDSLARWCGEFFQQELPMPGEQASLDI